MGSFTSFTSLKKHTSPYPVNNKVVFCSQSWRRPDRDTVRAGAGESAQCSQQLLIPHERASFQVSVLHVLSY